MSIITKIFKKIEYCLELYLRYYIKIKNIFYLLSANISSVIFGLLLSISLTRFLSKEVYGLYSYIMSILGILTIFTLPGMNTAIVQAVAKGYDGVFIKGTKERLKWSTISSSILFIMGIYYYVNKSQIIAKCLLFSSFIFPFYQATDTFQALLVGKKKFDMLAKYQSIIQVIPTIVIIIIIYYLRDLLIVIATYLVLISILKIIFFFKSKKLIKNINIDLTSFSFGRHLTFLGIISIVSHYIDRLIIGTFFSLKELATYTIALIFSEQIMIIGSITNTLIFPKLSEMNEHEAYLKLRKFLPYYLILFTIICCILILLCPYLIILFYSHKYSDSIVYAQVLLISTIAAQPALILTRALFPSQKKVRELYKVRISRHICELSALAIFSAFLGVWGIILSKFISRLFTTILSIYLFLRLRYKI